MPITHAWPKGRLTVVASAFVLASAGTPAWAGPRAPIVYAGDAATQSAPAMPARSVASFGGDKATERIEFRYPGDAGPVALVQAPKAPAPAAVQPDYSPGAFVIPAAARQGVEVIESAPLAPLAVPAPQLVSAPAADGARAVAIIYGDEFDGLPTANGEIFDQNALTAAHPTLPLPTLVQVTNPANGQQVELRVNDRGPFEGTATLQVSKQAARALGFDAAGQAELTLRPAGAPAPGAPPLPVQAKPFKMAAAPVASRTAELLGGDELAGGPVRRADVTWPEPPADWGVTPAVVKAGSAGSGALYLQLGSFSDIGNAESLYRGLEQDLPVEIVPARVNGTDFFRVRVGPLADRQTAQSLRDHLNAMGKGDGRIVTAD